MLNFVRRECRRALQRERFFFYNSFPLIGSSSTSLWIAFLHIPRIVFPWIQHLVTSLQLGSCNTSEIEILFWSCGVTSQQNTWSSLGHGCPSPPSSGIQTWWVIEASSVLFPQMFCLSSRGSGCSPYQPFLWSLKFSFSFSR